MEIYLLENCPICGGKIFSNGINMTGMRDWDESLWVKTVVEGIEDVFDLNPRVEYVPARYSTCVNDRTHYFNIRPYGDYDKHYVTLDELCDKLIDSKERYDAYQRLYDSLSETKIEKE